MTLTAHLASGQTSSSAKRKPTAEPPPERALQAVSVLAALAVLGARMRPGIEVILDLIELDKHLLGACAAVTGEGSLDHQALRGKGAVGVSRRAGAYGVPTFAVAGVSTLAPVEANTAGLAGVYALSDLEPDRQRSISRAGELLALATERLTRELLCSGTADDR